MIDEIAFRKVELPLSRAFVIAGSSQTVHTGIIVRIKAEGRVGWGEATPSPRVTGEDIQRSLNTLEDFRKRYAGSSIEDALSFSEPSAPAATASVNMALLDIKGKLEEKAIKDFLGGSRRYIPTSYTISIGDLNTVLRQAEEFYRLGVKVFKVKVGENVQEDINRVRILRERYPDVNIRLDGNEGYTPETAAYFIEKISELDIEFIEQPIPRGMHREMAALVREGQVPIMADEDLQSRADLEKIIHYESADMINIKLMKVGSITNGSRIAKLACDNNLKVMVGCMVETNLSITAGLHLALGIDCIDYADLDGNIDIAGDPTIGGAMFKDGMLYIPDGPGLGASFGMEEFT